MYSRQPNRDIRVPHNYSGNIFRNDQPPPTPVEDHTRKHPRFSGNYARERTQEQISNNENDDLREEQKAQEQNEHGDVESSQTDTTVFSEHRDCSESCEKDKKLPILSPIGELGTEEILLIALALIIFQSEKEPNLALILLALLFIK